MGDLQRLQELVFAGDNRACFIERDRALARLRVEYEGYEEPDRFPRIFAAMLAQMSTPIDAADYFGGRVVEGLPDRGMKAPETLLGATGHQTPNYEKLLKPYWNGFQAGFYYTKTALSHGIKRFYCL